MRDFLEQLTGRALVLGAIALIAVGISGGVAAALGATAGESFVAGDQPGVTYSAARCADYFEYSPHAHTCEQAATQHHYGEVVEYRIAAGLLGLGALGAIAILRRRRPALFATDRLPSGFTDTIAATAFGLAGIAMLAYAVDQAAIGNHGAGEMLSGGIVAALAAVAFATKFVRTAAVSH